MTKQPYTGVLGIEIATGRVAARVLWLQHDQATSNDDSGGMSVETAYEAHSHF